jgi:hypothetical protein
MKSIRDKAIISLLLIAFVIAAPVTYKIVRWKAYIWLPDYVIRAVSKSDNIVSSTVHVIFIFADHYEPGRGIGAVQRNREWLRRYMAMADRHRDSYGRNPQHTWFYAYEQRNDQVVKELADAVYRGYGEIEFHWHHSNDSAESLTQKLEQALAWFNSFGAMRCDTTGNSVRFAFIHGDWSLDNSRGSRYCGVSRELDILRRAGCYADFTFPSLGVESQPSKTNSIYYATDNDNPKSYDKGDDASVGVSHGGRFLIFEGPLGLALRRQLFEYGGIGNGDEAPSKSRVNSWIASGIAVRGRPEWIFVKVYTHGVQSESVVLGEDTDRMYSYLEQRYGRGAYRLHYVTAREAYNIVKAAEDCLSGDPDLYRDYEVKEPVNKHFICDVSQGSREAVGSR